MGRHSLPLRRRWCRFRGGGRRRRHGAELVVVGVAEEEGDVGVGGVGEEGKNGFAVDFGRFRGCGPRIHRPSGGRFGRALGAGLQCSRRDRVVSTQQQVQETCTNGYTHTHTQTHRHTRDEDETKTESEWFVREFTTVSEGVNE